MKAAILEKLEGKLTMPGWNDLVPDSFLAIRQPQLSKMCTVNSI